MNTTWIFALLIFIIIIILFIKYHNANVVYVKSQIDNLSYLVRDVEDKQQAANLLAKLRTNIITIANYLYDNKTKYPEYIPYIDQLKQRIKNVVIQESSEDSIYTSYSINKGEQIVFCLRSKHFHNKMHDLNLLMYVTLHEMAHVACPEYGHTPLFKKIFAFITNVAIDINLYKKTDYSNNPVEYCGLTITDSIV